MGLSPSGGHHRRRSSVLAGGPSQPSPIEQREDSSRPAGDGPGHKREEPKSTAADDADVSDLSSIAESVEMNFMSSDDEETGLTGAQRRQKRRRRKQRRQFFNRVLDLKASKQGLFPSGFGLVDHLGLADQAVISRLLVNAGLILLWYFFSLSISIYNKWMFSEDDVVFPFPLFTTSLHMVVQFTLSSTILYFIPSLRPQSPPAPSTSYGPSAEPGPIITKIFYLTRLVPCGTATSLDIGLGNMSLKFITLTFLTMCKSSALAFVLLFAFVFRLETPSVKLILIIATMTIGVVMMVAGETAFNAIGFFLVIASAFFSGFRWGLTQILLLRHPATANPFSTLFFLTPVMFFSLIIISLVVEGPSEIGTGIQALTAAHGPAFGVFLLIFPGVLAFCMISSEFALLKRSSVVTLSICGIFKEVITISAAGLIFHDQLTAVNITGLVVTIGSIACYNYMKIAKMRAEAQQNLGVGSPSMDPEADGSDSPMESDEYHYTPNPEVTTPYAHTDANANATPPNGVNSGRSFQALSSGTSSSTHGLTLNTSNLSDNGNPYSPRINSGPSPLKSAPPMVVSMEAELQKARLASESGKNANNPPTAGFLDD